MGRTYVPQPITLLGVCMYGWLVILPVRFLSARSEGDASPYRARIEKGRFKARDINTKSGGDKDRAQVRDQIRGYIP